MELEREMLTESKAVGTTRGRPRPLRLVLRAAALLPGILLLARSPAFAEERLWTTQIAAAQSQQDAEKRVTELLAQGLDAYWIRTDVPGVGTRYRVRIGRFASKAAAQENGERLRSQGVTREFFVAEYLPPTDATAAAATPAAPGTETQTATARAATRGDEEVFRTFRDKVVGYSFVHPGHWSGAAWSDAQSLTQNAEAGASFSSERDHASLRAVWTRLPGANDPKKYETNALVDTVLKMLAPATSVERLRELSRATETEGNQVKTYVDLDMLVRDPSTAGTLSFLCKAVVARCRQGVLLLAVFYPADASASMAASADRILRSAHLPG
jgi:hypothetical protein